MPPATEATDGWTSVQCNQIGEFNALWATF